MSELVIMVPGILGSELFLGDEQIWPPTIFSRRYDAVRLAKLQSPDLRVGNVVGYVFPYWNYRPIRQLLCSQLGYREFESLSQVDKSSDGVVFWSYDWRQDIIVSASRLRDELDQAQESLPDSIVFVCHSMGGLVVRCLLENDSTRSSWFSKVGKLIALATPHNGSIAALLRILGIEKTLTITAEDTKIIANNPQFPSIYQLLPPPTELSFRRLAGNRLNYMELGAVDQLKNCSLVPEMLTQWLNLRSKLDLARKPAHTDYVFAAAVGKATVTTLDLGAENEVLSPGVCDGVGDGTVAAWSAMPPPFAAAAFVGEHISFLRGQKVQQFVASHLTRGRFADESTSRGDSFVVVVDDLVVRASEPIEVSILFSKPMDNFKAVAVLEMKDGIGYRRLHEGSLGFSGFRTESLRASLPNPLQAGEYRIVVVAEDRSSSTDVFFVFA